MVSQVALFVVFQAVHLISISNLVTQSRWLSGLAPIVVLVLNGFVPSRAKASIVYWRIRDPLPGARAFTVHGPRDERVDMEVLESRYGPLPTKSTEQNRLWYRLYKLVEAERSVVDAHANFLLARDLTVTAVLLAIILSPASFLMHGWSKLTIGYSLYLIGQYFLLMAAARNYGNRFVCNVMAEAAVALSS